MIKVFSSKNITANKFPDWLKYIFISHRYPPNGYIISPTICAPNGQFYQLGLPPLHGHQPIYHFPSSPTQVYDPRDAYQSHSPLTPMSPIYQQPIVYSQQVLLNHHGNNNNVYSTNNNIYTPTTELNNNNLPIATTSPSTFTPVSVIQKPTPDIVPISANGTTHVTYNQGINTDGQLIMSGKPPVLNTNVHMINGNTHVVSNNPHVNNPQIINGNALVNNNNTHIVNGNAAHIIGGGNHMISAHNSITTFVSSPLPSPSAQNTTQNQMFQFQQQPQYISHRDLVPHREIIQ